LAEPANLIVGTLVARQGLDVGGGEEEGGHGGGPILPCR
jgi:hypothetical protein